MHDAELVEILLLLDRFIGEGSARDNFRAALTDYRSRRLQLVFGDRSVPFGGAPAAIVASAHGERADPAAISHRFVAAEPQIFARGAGGRDAACIDEGLRRHRRTDRPAPPKPVGAGKVEGIERGIGQLRIIARDRFIIGHKQIERQSQHRAVGLENQVARAREFALDRLQ